MFCFKIFILTQGLLSIRKKVKKFFSKGCKSKRSLANMLGCTYGSFPANYLGLPKDFSGLLNKLRNTQEGQMARVLSFASKVELVKSVIYGSMNYQLQSYKLPNSVSKELERMIFNFIWKGDIHSCSWDMLCHPKKESGIGLVKFQISLLLQISRSFGGFALQTIYGPTG